MTTQTGIPAKRCSRCAEYKPLTEFYADRSKPSGRASKCKTCSQAAVNEYRRGHGRERSNTLQRAYNARQEVKERRATYSAEPAQAEYNRAASAKQRIAFKEWLWVLKSKPCTDCGNFYHPVAMQFDHIPERGKKLFEVNMGASNRGQASILAELAKCELVCANCHAVRTFVTRSTTI